MGIASCGATIGPSVTLSRARYGDLTPRRPLAILRQDWTLGRFSLPLNMPRTWDCAGRVERISRVSSSAQRRLHRTLKLKWSLFSYPVTVMRTGLALWAGTAEAQTGLSGFSSMRTLLLLGLSGAIALSQGTTPSRAAECDAVGNVKFVCHQPAPEDFAVVPGSDWIFTSSYAPPGTINLINVRDLTAKVVFPSDP